MLVQGIVKWVKVALSDVWGTTTPAAHLAACHQIVLRVQMGAVVRYLTCREEERILGPAMTDKKFIAQVLGILHPKHPAAMTPLPEEM